RLPVFAFQPAPVQVSFAGYPASAGVESIPFRISDRYLESEIADRRWEIEPELRSSNSELRPAERVFLLDSFWCFDSGGLRLKINDSRASKNGWVTFGCVNIFSKINEATRRLWAAVLRDTKDSRLVLLSFAGSHRQRILEIFRRNGIEEHRVEFAAPRPRE